MITYSHDIERVLYTEEQIAARIKELGEELTHEYSSADMLAVCTLKGAVMFFADICRHIDCQLEIDFMRVSSYGNGTTPGDLIIKKDLEKNVTGKRILICDDIMDSGHTLYCLRELLMSRGAVDVKIACMFDKPSRRTYNITPDFIGFTVPDEFLVGYGLDFADRYRNLPFVGTLSIEAQNRV